MRGISCSYIWKGLRIFVATNYFMAKTKPIGVRFDEEILELIKKEQKLATPQKVLNFLMSDYCKPKSMTSENTDTNTSKEKSDKQSPKNMDEFKKTVQTEMQKIKDEKIPKDRDTILGRKYWNIEQQKRIKELEDKLK